MNDTYDCIVIGTGGVGSATLFHLARRGARVLGIDQYAPGHDRGSSHGETRLFRLAYFEHASYVPLLQRARDLWLELGQQAGVALYHESGILEVGARDGPVIGGVLQSAARHGLAVEELSPAMVEERWPGFAVPADHAAVFEPRAGYLSVEACVTAHVRLAESHGADLAIGAPVTEWSTEADGVIVSTEQREYRARRAVIALGAWSPDAVGELNIPLDVRRQATFWFAADDQYNAATGMPGFFFEDPAGAAGHGHYGVPAINDRGVKIARHHGGRPVIDPALVDRTLDPAELADAAGFARRHLPGIDGTMTHHTVCMYTNTPDGHFVVDRHPTTPLVHVAAGLSGHGFKFTSVLGAALADLVLDDRTDTPIEFLGLGRWIA